MIVMQVLAQGLGAGLVAVLAFSRAAALLGSGRAAFFGALVPGAASLLAIPVLGEVPTRRDAGKRSDRAIVLHFLSLAARCVTVVQRHRAKPSRLPLLPLSYPRSGLGAWLRT